MKMFSPIIIGTMRWGVWGASHNKNQFQKLIETALQEGFYTFDHADIYGGYTTEGEFGVAISEMNVQREDYQIITKCGIEYPTENNGFLVKSYNYSKKYILEQVDKSLKNLKTDYIDVLLLHRPSPLMNAEEIAAAFGVLRSNGKVKDFGVSNFSVSQFELLHQYFPCLITNQIQISINHLDAFYDGTLEQMMMKKLRPMAWSVMGNFFSETKTEQNQRIKKILNELCVKYEAEENQLLLAFLLKHPANILPIIGTSRAEQISVFRGALGISLDHTDWFRLLEASVGKRVP